MAEQPRKDPADAMPVHGEAARHQAPPRGPVPTSETVEARNKRLAEEAGADDELEYVPTPAEAFAERHGPELRRHARAMDRQAELQREQRMLGAPEGELRMMAQPKDNDDYTRTEQAIENNRQLVSEASHQMLADQTRLAELKRAEGDWPGRVFTVDPRDLNEVRSVEVRPPGDPDVVTAFPQGLSSRHVPESRTTY